MTFLYNPREHNVSLSVLPRGRGLPFNFANFFFLSTSFTPVLIPIFKATLQGHRVSRCEIRTRGKLIFNLPVGHLKTQSSSFHTLLIIQA